MLCFLVLFFNMLAPLLRIFLFFFGGGGSASAEDFFLSLRGVHIFRVFREGSASAEEQKMSFVGQGLAKVGDPGI